MQVDLMTLLAAYSGYLPPDVAEKVVQKYQQEIQKGGSCVCCGTNNNFQVSTKVYCRTCGYTWENDSNHES
ncbi:hypothetical protein [Anabaena sp. CCY 0017]|uniref:hypothetical protein n=1 Tax=Anabaena sp. CCY 0017 TaxID=3103866 RepID=UPI0039C6F73A